MVRKQLPDLGMRGHTRHQVSNLKEALGWVRPYYSDLNAIFKELYEDYSPKDIYKTNPLLKMIK